MTPKSCSWILKNDFAWTLLSKQDLKLIFTKAVNVKIYLVSYFFEDRESKTQYFTQQVEIDDLIGKSLTFEMYNTTEIYVVPTNSGTNEVEFEF